VGERLTSGWDDGFGAPASVALGAASAAYRGMLRTRRWLYARGVLRARALPCPVISIGNLTVGGTGKTPAVELAVRTLIEQGHRPAVVSRGYGRKSRGVHLVADSASIRLAAEEAGDEPFLLARRLPGTPVVVGADRWEAGRMAIDRCGATAIVLDDGFQQRTLATSLNVVMARARKPWGNGRLLPAGPLREPLTALERADLVLATGPRDATGDEVAPSLARYATGVPLVTATLEPVACWDASTLASVPLSRIAAARAVAFAGIARPESFAATLAALGIKAAVVAFRDHHWYTPEDLRSLAARAAAADALVTTEKDWVRLRHHRIDGLPVYVVSVALTLTSGAAAWRAAFERWRSA
jgi:tetraacyldisaccharide 4'-kinase